MYGEEKYVMTPFQRMHYRFLDRAVRRADRGSTVTTISLGENGEKTEKRVVIGPGLPSSLEAITRIAKVDSRMNAGERRIEYLRLLVEIDDRGQKGAMGVVFDLTRGTIDFWHGYAAWSATSTHTHYGVNELHQPANARVVLALYRLCELSDAQGDHYGRQMIAEALHRPNGRGFPGLARGPGRALLERFRQTEPCRVKGQPEGVVHGGWYAQLRPDWDHRLDHSLRCWISQVIDLRRAQSGLIWDDRAAAQIRWENEGFGRVDIEPCILGQMWVSDDGTHKLIKLQEDEAAALRAFVTPRFDDTSSLVRAMLK